MLLTLANIRTISEVILAYVKDIVSTEDKTFKCPEISMILYGDHEALSYDVTYEIGPESERCIQYGEPISFNEIKNAVCKIGEIYRVEIITSTNKSLVFESRGYRVSRKTKEGEYQYSPLSTFAENVENTLYELFLD